MRRYEKLASDPDALKAGSKDSAGGGGGGDSPRAHMLRPMLRGRGQGLGDAEEEQDPAAAMAGNMRVGRWQPVLKREHHAAEEAKQAAHASRGKHSIKDASVSLGRNHTQEQEQEEAEEKAEEEEEEEEDEEGKSQRGARRGGGSSHASSLAVC